MSVDVLTEIVINRPADVVAAYAMDPNNAPEWYVNIKSVEWETEPPVQLGSRVAFVARFLGKRLAYTYEIKELEPGAKMVMGMTEGPFPMETTYEFSPVDEGSCTMRLRNRGVPTGFAKVGAGLMAAQMRKANQKDLESIKRILEATA